MFDNHKFTNNHAMHRFQRSFMPEPVHPAVLAFLRSRTESSFSIADKHLADRAFMLGERPTIVDFSLAGYVYYPSEETGLESQRLSGADAWRRRLAALPGWKPPYELLPAGSDFAAGNGAARLAMQLRCEGIQAVVKPESGRRDSDIRNAGHDSDNLNRVAQHAGPMQAAHPAHRIGIAGIPRTNLVIHLPQKPAARRDRESHNQANANGKTSRPSTAKASVPMTPAMVIIRKWTRNMPRNSWVTGGSFSDTSRKAGDARKK